MRTQNIGEGCGNTFNIYTILITFQLHLPNKGGGKMNLNIFMSVSPSTDKVLRSWRQFMLLSDRKQKAMENAASAYGHMRAVTKYLQVGWEAGNRGGSLCWLFLDQPEHLQK